MPTRYSQLAYSQVIILNGGEHLSDIPGSFTRAMKADVRRVVDNPLESPDYRQGQLLTAIQRWDGGRV